MINLIRRLVNFITKAIFYCPKAWIIIRALALKSHINFLRMSVLGKTSHIHFEKVYRDQKILLIALYEKGELRPDIQRLLSTAKKLGMYVVAVNTQKLEYPLDQDALIDCYIERPNYGRDFGSYKSGLLHMYRQRWNETCPRLLLMNDSVFYTSNGLESFLVELQQVNKEVAGATENHLYEHHLGSFCISMHGKIIRQEAFKRFWLDYKNSEIRPTVIKNGEFKLSRCLKKAVSSPGQFSAAYDINRVATTLESSPEIINEIENFSTGQGYSWVDGKPSLQSIYKRINERFIFTNPKLDGSNIHVQGATTDIKTSFANSPDELIDCIKSSTNVAEESGLEFRIRQEARIEILNSCLINSQIHINAVLLHKIGLPIVKTDSLYRGTMKAGDIEEIACSISDEAERSEFRTLMYARPYGVDTLSGWKRAAFDMGWI